MIDPAVYLHAAKRIALKQNDLSCVAVSDAAGHRSWRTSGWLCQEVLLYTDFFAPRYGDERHPYWNQGGWDGAFAARRAELRDLRITALLFMYEIAKDLK